jgi:hypothetical protein
MPSIEYYMHLKGNKDSLYSKQEKSTNIFCELQIARYNTVNMVH